MEGSKEVESNLKNLVLLSKNIIVKSQASFYYLQTEKY